MKAIYKLTVLCISFCCQFAYAQHATVTKNSHSDSVRAFVKAYAHKEIKFYGSLRQLFLKGTDVPSKQNYLIRLDTDEKSKIKNYVFSKNIPEDKRSAMRTTFDPLVTSINQGIFLDKLLPDAVYIITLDIDNDSGIEDVKKYNLDQKRVPAYSMYDFEDGKSLEGNINLLIHLYTGGPLLK